MHQTAILVKKTQTMPEFLGISEKSLAVIGTRVESVDHTHVAALPLYHRTALDYSRQESVGLSM